MKNFCLWQDCLTAQSFCHEVCGTVAFVHNGRLLLWSMIQMITPLFLFI